MTDIFIDTFHSSSKLPSEKPLMRVPEKKKKLNHVGFKGKQLRKG